MLVIEVTLNAFWIPVLIAVSCIAGFLLRSGQLASTRKKIAELEKEVMSSHAEILDLLKEKVQIEQRLQNTGIPPVIPISSAKDENLGEKNLPDVGVRKKLLGKQPVQEKSQPG